MLRFRIWDNESQEYLENLDSFSMDNDGHIRWYDGCYLNEEKEASGRYEVEYGNGICFHNDIVQASKHGGHWRIERAGMSYYDDVPREYVNMHVYKGGIGSGVHDLYWDIPIRGIAIMCRDIMEFVIAGLTCKDEFYGYEGDHFSWGDVSVVGNARLDEHDFCKKRRERYERMIETSILPIKGE